MSGIVGSYFNTRGSGVVAKLGTDGQVFTSTGAGLSQGFEAAAGGGLILQIVQSTKTDTATTSSTTYVDTPDMSVAITPTKASSKILLTGNMNMTTQNDGFLKVQRDIESAGYADLTGYRGDDSSSNRQDCTHQMMGSAQSHSNCFMYLDSPSYTLTDVITYKIVWLTGNASYPNNLNRTWTDSDGIGQGRTASTIQCWEID